jgi:hypothetical protein
MLDFSYDRKAHLLDLWVLTPGEIQMNMCVSSIVVLIITAVGAVATMPSMKKSTREDPDPPSKRLFGGLVLAMIVLPLTGGAIAYWL